MDGRTLKSRSIKCIICLNWAMWRPKPVTRIPILKYLIICTCTVSTGSHRSSCWCRFFALSLVAFRTVSDLGTSLVLEKFSVFSFSVPGIGFAFTDFFPWMSVDFPELTRSTSGSESMSISPQSHALFWESLKEVQPNMVVPVNISSAVALHPAIDHVTVGDVVSNYILHPLHNRFTV